MKLVGLLSIEDDFSELQLIAKIFLLQEHMKDVVAAYQPSSNLPPSKTITPSTATKQQRYRLPKFTVHGLT